MAHPAAIVITTRNRRSELRKALDSCLAQTVATEIIVVDDASTDDTADMVRKDYPGVTLIGSAEQLGLIVRRNEATRYTSAPIVFSLDDDAYFDSPTTVEEILAQFSHPRIGVVNIPVINIRDDPNPLHVPPDRTNIWVQYGFLGTCYAMRRDVWERVNGYRETLFHWGEEIDFAVRMLDLGYVVRRGHAQPVIHVRSDVRNLYTSRLFLHRNQMLLFWLNFPFRYVPGYTLAAIWRAVWWGITQDLPLVRLASVAKGFRDAIALRRQRRPLKPSTCRLAMRLRRVKQLRLEEVEPLLPPLPADTRPHPGKTSGVT